MLDQQSDYRNFCALHRADLPVFFQDWYLDAVCTDGEWGVATVRYRGEIVGVWPWFRKAKWGFRYLTLPPFTKYLGPWILPTYSDHRWRLRWTEELVRQLPRVHAIKTNCSYQFSNWLPLYWAGFQQTTRYSYQLNLQSGLDTLYAGVNRNIRRNIKSAQQLLRIKRCDDPALFYRINALSFRRQGISPPYSYGQFLQHYESIVANQAGYFYQATDAQKNVHSVACVIRDQQRAYYHLSGDDPELRNSGSGILMVWEGIRWATEEEQLPIFDFEGSMIRSVGAIRRQFGASPIPYSQVWRYDSRLFALIDYLRK